MIRYRFPAYNGKRFSKPWVAGVLLGQNQFGTRLDYDFEVQSFRIDDGPGTQGVIEICDVAPDSVIVIGQKDRKTNQSTKKFFIVGHDGRIEPDLPSLQEEVVDHLRQQEEREPDEVQRQNSIFMIRSIMEKEGIGINEL